MFRLTYVNVRTIGKKQDYGKTTESFFHVCNSAISFHFMCVDYVVHIAFLCTELFLCFILVVFYIVFYIVYHCN